VSDYPTRRLPIQPGSGGYHGSYQDYDDGYSGSGPSRGRRRSRGRRALTILLVTLVVLAGLFVVADRMAVRIADNEFATQIQKQGFSSKPHVSIEGFPFLTQVAARQFNEVRINATGEKAGPLTIDNIAATLRGIKLTSGFKSGTVSSISGTGLITFGSLASASPVPIAKIIMINSSEARLTVDLGFFSGDAVAKIAQVGHNKINVRVISAGGLPLSSLGQLSNFTLTLPALPMGMTLQSVSVTAQGLLVRITGHNVSFSS
jgi:LmeA-like phospholipid-binding